MYEPRQTLASLFVVSLGNLEVCVSLLVIVWFWPPGFCRYLLLYFLSVFRRLYHSYLTIYKTRLLWLPHWVYFFSFFSKLFFPQWRCWWCFLGREEGWGRGGVGERRVSLRNGECSFQYFMFCHFVINRPWCGLCRLARYWDLHASVSVPRKIVVAGKIKDVCKAGGCFSV